MTAMKSQRASGYTLVELMVVVCIIGLLASIATPAFVRYIKRSKTAEARELVRKIYDGARAYYMDSPIATPMFPEPSQPATPALGTCCASGGRCTPSTTYWQNQTWISLAFSVDEPAYYMYAYDVVGNPAAGAPVPVDGSNRYTALAYGDLDCNGIYSTFSVFGVIDETYADGPAGNAAVGAVAPLE
jgi:prepilin-type N-terminal cleavage/methylation domain-containing protein